MVRSLNHKKLDKHNQQQNVHATWLVGIYNHLSSPEGRQSIVQGWKKAGVTDVVSGSKKLSTEDPFENQAPVVRRADNVIQWISRFPADKMYWLE